MDCILRVVKGPDAGASCRLTPGPNLVGRSLKAALRLTPSDISYEHLLITRNGDQYLAENLSALGTYADDARLTGPLKLRPRDELRLSEGTVVRFEALGAEGSSFLADYKVPIIVGLAVLAVAAGVLALVRSSGAVRADWRGAYGVLEAWADETAGQGKLPADVPRLFRDAWRYEVAEDYQESKPAWLRLTLRLEEIDDQCRFGDERERMSELAGRYPTALTNLVSPPEKTVPELSDERKAAAFKEFALRRLSWATLKTKPARSLQ